MDQSKSSWQTAHHCLMHVQSYLVQTYDAADTLKKRLRDLCGLSMHFQHNPANGHEPVCIIGCLPVQRCEISA